MSWVGLSVVLKFVYISKHVVSNSIVKSCIKISDITNIYLFNTELKSVMKVDGDR